MRTCNGYLFKRGSTFYACWQHNKHRFIRTTGTGNRREAEKVLEKLLEPFQAKNTRSVLENVQARITGLDVDIARLDAIANPPLTVKAAWDVYERAGNRKEASPSTLAVYLSHWRSFEAWLTKDHPKITALQDITFSIAEAYRDRLLNPDTKGRVRTGRSFNGIRAFLVAFTNVLLRAGKIRLPDGNPWQKLAKRDEHSVSRRMLTVEELRKVCRTAQGELRTLFAIGLFTGARLHDAACMDWGCVDLVRGQIRYIPRKTARKVKNNSVAVTIHRDLLAILSETPASKRKGPVLPQLAELYTRRGPDGVSELVQAHFLKCGLTTNKNREGAGIRRAVDVGFHSLRHTAVSLMREGGAAQSVSQAIVGHGSSEIHQLYTHTDEEAVRRAVNMLPAVLDDSSSLPAREPVPNWIKVKLSEMTSTTWKAIQTEILRG